MITPAYSLTATERVLPRLALDWTTGLAQTGVDVTRAGVATFVGSNGYIQSATANTQRLDWTNSTSGLLVEESRINQVLYSEDFSNGAWYTIRTNKSSGSGVTPSNSSTVFKLVEDTTASSNHRIGQSFTSAANSYVYSIFARPAGRNWIQLCTAALTGVFFDIANGTVGTANGGHVGSIKAFKDGWYRCSVAYTSTSGARPLEIALATANGTTSYTGDGVSGVEFYGAQIEAGAFPTSYIPTEATAVTRNADVATMTGTNFSGWYNATEGTFVATASSAGGVNPRIWNISNGTSSNRIQVVALTATNVIFQISNGGVSQASINVDVASITNANTYATTYKVNNFAGAVNGGSVFTDNSGTIPAVSLLRFGMEATGVTASLNGHIQKFLYYPQRLTNAELAAFSK